MQLPNHHNTLMVYLIVNDARKLQEFLLHVFEATLLVALPPDDSGPLHAEARIGDTTLMFSQASADWGAQPAGLFIYVPDADMAMQKALDKGATLVLPLEDKDYGRSGGVRDTNDNVWWITALH